MFAVSEETRSHRESEASRSPYRSLRSDQAALVELGQALRGRGYRFTTITPISHARVLARTTQGQASLADIFGWSRHFRLSELDPALAELGKAADIFEIEGGATKSRVRFSSLGDLLFAHSAYPTQQVHSVFFGPDTYRFCRLIRSAVADMKGGSRTGPFKILDLGAGSGAGGLYAALCAGQQCSSLTLSDINIRALDYCAVNSALNQVRADSIVQSDLFHDVGHGFDLIVANPPYLRDKLARAYRHGGGALGAALSVRILTEGVPRLAPGGRLVLYTGSAIVNGRDQFGEVVSSWACGRSLRMSYEEIDPDVFGEELDQPPYDIADRIAVVSVIVEVPGS